MVLKALVVDDEEMMLDILEYILKSDGYDITRVTDGDQAIKILDAEDFDLVITDLHMGPTSGLDVIRKTKDINPDTIIIMITGGCNSSDEAEAFHCGVDDCLLKPFFPSDLRARIKFQKYEQLFTTELPAERESNPQ